MPYTIRKQSCTQSSGKKGSYTLSYTDKKGKKHNNCHTSKKKAQGQIAGIEMHEDDEVLLRKQEVAESYDVDTRDTFLEWIMITVMGELLDSRGQRRINGE